MATTFTTTLFFPRLVLFLFLLSMGVVIHAVPMNIRVREALDEFVPPVTDPHTGTVWKVEQFRDVTWDVFDAPVNITNSKGRIQLRKGDQTLPLILADGFDVRAGTTKVRVPWVIPDSDYSIVFFGDSGDFSDTFTISN